jgi:tetratricopeptide (TPR) repeat protein
LKILIGALAASLVLAGGAKAASLDEDLAKLARGWDYAAYESGNSDAQIAALTNLEMKADDLAGKFPQAAEPLAWKAIIVSTKANAADGMKALNFAEDAKKQLEKVAEINPDPLHDGSVYAMLGALYDGVPGFPVGFGSKAKARKFLQKAVEQNPAGADTNYFYGVYLAGQKRFEEAVKFLRTALSAPARPGREIGDEGRKRDILEQLREIDAKLARK